MLAGRRIAVVIPARNEAQLILATLEGIPKFVDHIIVVDDGSTDSTSQNARTVSWSDRTDRAWIQSRRWRCNCDGLPACSSARRRRNRGDGRRRTNGPAGPAGIAGACSRWRGRLHPRQSPWLAGCTKSDAVAQVDWQPCLFVADQTSHRRQCAGFAVRICVDEPPHSAGARLGSAVEGLWVSERSIELTDAQRTAREADSGPTGVRRGAERDTASARAIYHPVRDRARVDSQTCATTTARPAVTYGCTG